MAQVTDFTCKPLALNPESEARPDLLAEGSRGRDSEGQGLECRRGKMVEGLGFRLWGLGFRAEGLGFGV